MHRKGNAMKIESYKRGEFQILKISTDEDTVSELSELQDLIYGYVDRGQISIAVSFTNATYIYSGAVRVLINCHKLVAGKGGRLCIIEPDPSLFDVLELLNIDRVIHVYVSEEYLPIEC